MTSGSLPHPEYQMGQYLPHCLTSRIVWNYLRLTSSSRVSNEAISPSLPRGSIEAISVSLLHLEDQVRHYLPHCLISRIKWGNIFLTWFSLAHPKDRVRQHLHTITAKTRENTLNEKKMYDEIFFCLSPKNYASRFIRECVTIIHPWYLNEPQQKKVRHLCSFGHNRHKSKDAR